MKKCKNKNSGFSLIELLLVMGIFAFLAAASVQLVTNFNKKQTINIAYDGLHKALAQAKSYALSQVITENCNVSLDQAEIDAGITNTDELIGYQVEFDVTSNPDKHTYAIYEICLDGASGLEKTPINNFVNPPISEYSLPSGIYFQGAPTPIRFNVLTGGAQSSQDITIETTDPALNQVRAIRIDTNGVIKDVSP